MNQFLIFWNQYKEIIYIGVAILCFVLGLVIKKKKTLNSFDQIVVKVMENLPAWINAVEFYGFSGAEKKALVIESIKKFVKDSFGIVLPDTTLTYFGSIVEDILSTPQKKEK